MTDELNRFDWALVKSFLAVLDAGSLTGAARKTGALQPTLSRHISELEAQWGTPLFERTGRDVSQRHPRLPLPRGRGGCKRARKPWPGRLRASRTARPALCA
jgi:hypothetical protein